MKLVVENIPDDVAGPMLAEIRRRGVSVDEVVIGLLRREFIPQEPPPPRRDLSRFIGSRPDDPAFEAALREMRRPDPEPSS